MKTVITAVLALSLAFTPFQATLCAAEKQKRPEAQESIGLALLVLGAAAVGAVIVLTVHARHKAAKGPVRIVLERSANNVDWVPVATNTVVLNGQQPIEFFQETRRDGHSFYRARVENLAQ